MLRRTLAVLKISKVAIPTHSKSLSYTHNYRKNIDYNLGKRFAAVTEKNRYEALNIIFGEKLDGHVGRRQYKVQSHGQGVAKIADPLAAQGIDWHDLKGLGRSELLDVCDLLKLDSSLRTLFLTAVESKMCGVLTRSGKDRNPRTICTRPGRLQHGWRCGVAGHSHDTFFEGKPEAVASELAATRLQGFLGLSYGQRQLLLDSSHAALKTTGGEHLHTPLRLPRGQRSVNTPSAPLPSPSAFHTNASLFENSNINHKALSPSHDTAGDADGQGSQEGGPIGAEGVSGFDSHSHEAHAQRQEEGVARTMENGIQVEHRKAPDFSIFGRHQERQILNPRVWTSPSNPTFNVSSIGIEMRVHPDDPRAVPQIIGAHKEWAMHADVVRHVVWEMLELYGVERPPQPLDMEDGELGEPDSIFSFSSAFWGSSLDIQMPAGPSDGSSEGAASSGGGGAAQIDPSEVAIERRMVTDEGESVPWFTPPLPQRFEHGVPHILPFAPTIIIRGVYRQVSEVVSLGDDGLGGSDQSTLSPDALIAKQKALLEKHLHYPLMDISVLKHPDACFWWNKEDEEKAIGHILSYARKVPFALPFNMYIRVDPSRALRRHFTAAAPSTKGESSTSSSTSGSGPSVGPLSEAFASDLYLALKERQEAKRQYFDLLNFRASAWLAADPKGGVMGADTDDGDRAGSAQNSEESLFGGARSSRRPMEDERGDAATRHPEAFDEEVTIHDIDIDVGGASAGDDLPRAGGSSRGNVSANGVGSSFDDGMFPDVNPEGWS